MTSLLLDNRIVLIWKTSLPNMYTENHPSVYKKFANYIFAQYLVCLICANTETMIFGSAEDYMPENDLLACSCGVMLQQGPAKCSQPSLSIKPHGTICTHH